MSQPKLLIIDFDGPVNDLIKTKKLILKKVAKNLKIYIDCRTQKHFLTYIDQIYQNEKITNYQKIIKRCLIKLKEHGLLEIKEPEIKRFAFLFEKNVRKSVKVNIHFLKILKKIKAKNKIKLCIYSSQIKNKVIRLLKEQDVKLFDIIYGRDNFNEPKPSVKNLEKICDELGVLPKDTLMIGDNAVMDLMPAKLLGMTTLLINPFVDKIVKKEKDFAQTIDLFL